MKVILTLLLGVLLGGAAAYFLFVGTPRVGTLKGQPVRAPDPGGHPPGTAVVELDEQFFGALLDGIFRDLNKPAFPPCCRSVKSRAEVACRSPRCISMKPRG